MRKCSFKRMLRSLIVIPVSCTLVSVPTPTEPLWTRLTACSCFFFLLPNMCRPYPESDRPRHHEWDQPAEKAQSRTVTRAGEGLVERVAGGLRHRAGVLLREGEAAVPLHQFQRVRRPGRAGVGVGVAEVLGQPYAVRRA